MDHGGITIIYDGKCPFCSSYVSMLRLRQEVGEVRLLNAREADPQVAGVVAAGHDLDSGMVVIWRARYFHGRDAVHLLATLSGDGGLFNRLQRRVFASPRRAALLYPVLAAGRRMWLRLAGTPPISDRPGKSANEG